MIADETDRRARCEVHEYQLRTLDKAVTGLLDVQCFYGWASYWIKHCRRDFLEGLNFYVDTIHFGVLCFSLLGLSVLGFRALGEFSLGLLRVRVPRDLQGIFRKAQPFGKKLPRRTVAYLFWQALF